MRIAELVIAAVFLAGGLRSVWTWTRRRFEGTDVTDHLLYALYLTGRIGLWFAIAGFFLIFAAIRGGSERIDDFDWYLMVPLGLAVLQFAAGYALGRREPDAGSRSRR